MAASHDTERAAKKKEKKELPSLGVKCTDSRCDEGLHAFRPKANATAEQIGHCISCGVGDLVDWERAHQRDPGDFEYLRGAFEHELIRHEFWKVEIPDRVRDLALRPRGGHTLAEMIERNVGNAIGPPASEIFWEGQQTPFPDSENARIYHYGQHATGTCCRRCLEYWHGIGREVRLERKDLGYTTNLVWRYIDEKLG